jgi:hypothetical protein
VVTRRPAFEEAEHVAGVVAAGEGGLGGVAVAVRFGAEQVADLDVDGAFDVLRSQAALPPTKTGGTRQPTVPSLKSRTADTTQAAGRTSVCRVSPRR